MRDLRTVIEDVLARYNVRQSFRGTPGIPHAHVPPLASMLEVEVQRAIDAAVDATFDEPEPEAVDLEAELSRAYEVIAVLVASHEGGAAFIEDWELDRSPALAIRPQDGGLLLKTARMENS